MEVNSEEIGVVIENFKGFAGWNWLLFKYCSVSHGAKLLRSSDGLDLLDTVGRGILLSPGKLVLPE